jgi:hypothetical protein
MTRGILIKYSHEARLRFYFNVRRGQWVIAETFNFNLSLGWNWEQCESVNIYDFALSANVEREDGTKEPTNKIKNKEIEFKEYKYSTNTRLFFPCWQAIRSQDVSCHQKLLMFFVYGVLLLWSARSSRKSYPPPEGAWFISKCIQKVFGLHWQGSGRRTECNHKSK